jgi:site-specific DNA-methyltransferase (adenine-specific)
LNIDGCRVTTSDTIEQSGEKVTISRGKIAEGYDRPNRTMYRTDKPKERSGPAAPLGRWPANLVHDGSDEVVGLFPLTVGVSSGERRKGNRIVYGNGLNQPVFGQDVGYGDSGSASRFFQQVTIK